MKVFKRAWISIIRRRINSLVLLLIVFVLANVLLTTLTVTTSIKSTKEMVLKQFPPTVTIEYNNENYDIEKTPKLTSEQVDEVYRSTQELIKSYDYSYYMYLTGGENIRKTKLFDDEIINEINNRDNLISLSGTQLSSTNLVEKGEAKLISGKGFNITDINEGKPKAIISKQFAQLNELEIGSLLPLMRMLYEFDTETLTTGQPYFSEDIELEIVGIVEINEIDDFIKKDSSKLSENSNDKLRIQKMADEIYVPNSFIYPLIKDNVQRSLEKYPEEKGTVPGITQYPQIYPEFVLKDMKNLNVFIEKAKKVYNEKDYSIISAASEYETVAKPLSSMGDLLDLVFKITVATSIVVLTLVLYIFMYLRQMEMGIFLALGERRWKIIGQLLMETLVIAIIGATIAIFTSFIFSNILTNNTINSLLSPSNDLNSGMVYMNADYGLTPEIISAQVQGGFGIMTFVSFYGTMASTIIISQFVTVLYLLRLNPKKILL